MTRISIVNAAHEFIAAHLTSGDLAIDATVGNGFDSQFLLNQVTLKGKVYGFDIQSEAIAATQIRTHQPDNLRLFCACHSEMPRFIPASDHGLIKAVMFNLGYLPGGDRATITRSETTLAALEQVLNVLLAPRGVVSIVVYPGHAGGSSEADAVKTWCLALPTQRYHVSCLSSDPTNPAAPSLLMIKA